jgi:MoxR-like ATPase
MGYPPVADEKEILRTHALHHPIEEVAPVMTAEDVLDLQEEVKHVKVDDALVDYMMDIVSATRESEVLDLGVSPRGSLALFRAAQAMALTEEREYCIADDIKRLVVPIFSHRIVINSRYSSRLRRGEESDAVLTEILRNAKVPI